MSWFFPDTLQEQLLKQRALDARLYVMRDDVQRYEAEAAAHDASYRAACRRADTLRSAVGLPVRTRASSSCSSSARRSSGWVPVHGADGVTFIPANRS